MHGADTSCVLRNVQFLSEDGFDVPETTFSEVTPAAAIAVRALSVGKLHFVENLFL